MDTDTTDVNITTDVDKIIEKVEEFAKGYEEHHQKHKEIDELQMESIQIRKKMETVTTDVDKIIEKVEEHYQKHKEIDELQMESIQICNEIIKNNEECIEWKDKRIDLLMETIRLKDERIHSS